METKAPVDWIKNLERRTRHARLQLASPEYVCAELRTYGEEVLSDILFQCGDEKLENAMLARGEPLIDIALASFAARTATLAELWNRGTTNRYQNESVSKAIRIACLSNRAVDKHRFPASVIGENETRRGFASIDNYEADALFSNERIDDDFLVALYEHKEPFDSIPEDRWLYFIARTGENNRLNLLLDTDYGPDLRYGSIQGAIFRLLEIAPTTDRWVKVLHRHLLEALNPAHVVSPSSGRIGPVLDRWSKVEMIDYRGNIEEGQYTSLSAIDEFRCLVGALYGIGGANPTAPDVAVRCSYYGNANLTAKEIEKYADREGYVFSYAAICNTSVLHNTKLRHLIEEKGSGQLFKHRYLRICKLINAYWPNFDPRPTADWMKM